MRAQALESEGREPVPASGHFDGNPRLNLSLFDLGLVEELDEVVSGVRRVEADCAQLVRGLGRWGWVAVRMRTPATIKEPLGHSRA